MMVVLLMCSNQHNLSPYNRGKDLQSPPFSLLGSSARSQIHAGLDFHVEFARSARNVLKLSHLSTSTLKF